MNNTTNPDLKSFIRVDRNTHFPIQNLPYCIFSTRDRIRPRTGVGIGTFILDLSILESAGFFSSVLGRSPGIFANSSLNPFMQLGPDTWRPVRSIVSNLLRKNDSRLRDDPELRSMAFVPMTEAVMQMPVSIGDYTDFYASLEHAGNLGRIFRGGSDPLPQNWRHLPVAYHGRASSIILNREPVRRPQGQFLDKDSGDPVFAPTRQLDFELELGFFIGTINEPGKPIKIEAAPDHIFGFVLVNDWSARDIQKWEYQPLGPFLGKNFATSISPWVVPLEALLPFRCKGPEQKPEPLPYLRQKGNWALDITLEIYLKPCGGSAFQRISAGNARSLYWNFSQQIAHHTSNGCNLRTGDLLASGTISGADRQSLGSLIEMTAGGTKPLRLKDTVQRLFLEDGDTVMMTGYAQGDGYRVGFGEVTGTVIPAEKDA
jgi:fumarylacetoacetase